MLRSSSLKTLENAFGALLIGWGLPLAPAAHADFTLHSWELRGTQPGDPQGTKIALSAQYFSTESNYDYQGTLLAPAGLTKYSRFLTDLDLTHSLSSRLSIFGRLSWIRAEIDNTFRPGEGYGLADQTIGASYQLLAPESSSGFIRSGHVQVQVDIPAYDNATADTDQTPHLGDQSVDATIGGFITGRISRNQKGSIELTGGAGYTVRSNGFSAALPWSIQASYRPARAGFLGDLQIYGVQTLQGDARAKDFSLVNSTTVSAGSGGSYITGAINPTLMAIRGSVGYETSDAFTVRLNATKTVIGQFQPNGFLIGAALEKRFGANGSRPSLDRGSSHSSQGAPASNSGFVSYAFEARVVRVNDRLHQVKIDRGSQDSVEKGQVFDLFTTRTDGGVGEPVARARVTSVDLDNAVLTISEYFKEVWIEEGFVVKRPLQ